jgi:putative nucleotidyltransferase with HDIG domain
VTNSISKPFRSSRSRTFFRVVLIICTSLISIAALVLPIALRPASYPIQVGAVAQNDVVAPNAATFESNALTNLAKEKAAVAVSPMYLPSNPSIARTQIDNLVILFNYIKSIRADAYSTIDQKVADLQALQNVRFSQESIDYILQTSDARWEQIEQQSVNVLEQVMRNNIRDYQVSENQDNIPNLIDLNFTGFEPSVIEQIVSPFVVANSLYSEEGTNAAKDKAMETVNPVYASYIEGQVIVRRGQIISEEQFEALQYFGLVKPENKLTQFLASSLIVILMSTFIVVYFNRRRLSIFDDLRSLSLISILFLCFLIAGRIVIPNRTILPYFFPLPAFALILAALFNIEIASIFSIVLSSLIGYGLSNSFELTAFYIFSSLIGALFLGKGSRVSSFFTAGVFLSLAGCTVLAAFRYIDNTTDLLGMVTLFAVSFMNGFASASIALLIQYVASQILGLSNPLHLLEISRPDNPLLQYILQNAPGTYQHSLQVSNLAEQGAKAIGADAILTRVGALYHDCGKTVNAQFFIENQLPKKIDPHENMKPEVAAQTIIKHVSDGIALAAKHHLPPRIKDFIREHHGTAVTRYHYCRAIEHANKNSVKVNKSLYTYPGPKPRSKETALVMLADGCEARARAELPKTDEELRALIHKVIETCLQDGQLDESPLTLKDLRQISETFFTILTNIHHPRLKYPESQEEMVQVSIEKTE